MHPLALRGSLSIRYLPTAHDEFNLDAVGCLLSLRAGFQL